MSEAYNPYATAQKQFDGVAEMIGLEPAVRELLRQPMREYHFTIPVRMDNGEVRSSKVTGSSIMMPGGRQKAASAFTPRRPWIPSGPWPCG